MCTYIPIMRSHSEIVAAAGEARLVRVTRVSRHTVQSWKKRDSIPAGYWNDLAGDGLTTVEELAAGVRPRKSAA